MICGHAAELAMFSICFASMRSRCCHVACLRCAALKHSGLTDLVCVHCPSSSTCLLAPLPSALALQAPHSLLAPLQEPDKGETTACTSCTGVRTACRSKLNKVRMVMQLSCCHDRHRSSSGLSRRCRGNPGWAGKGAMQRHPQTLRRQLQCKFASPLRASWLLWLEHCLREK